jgi:flagella basal body P-ring formation protein FlgA
VVSPHSEVKLVQLVEAEGLSPEATRRLQEILLSRAPEFGERQELANATLTSVLRPIVQMERERGSSKVHVSIPKLVIIDTVKRDITNDRVRDELLQAWQPLCEDCRLEIEGLSLPLVQGVRDWSLKIKAELPRGSFSVPVAGIRQDSSPFQAWISGRLLTKRKVPVAKKIFQINERVQPQDYDWQYKDTSLAMDGIPEDSEIVGRQVKRGLHAGEVLWKGNLEKEKAIRRGDLVTVKSGEAMWEVSVSVIAQQDAYIGDVVNLKHPKNGTQLAGKVVGQGEVELR